MKTAWWSAALWALVAASAVAWGLAAFGEGRGAPAHTVVAQSSPPPAGELTRLFGPDPVETEESPEEVPAAARFQLLGVVAPKNEQSAGRTGVALIAVDGKPPHAYRVGAAVDGELVLKAVRQRGADLGARGGPASVALTIAALPPAATGTPADAAPAPAAVAPPRYVAPRNFMSTGPRPPMPQRRQRPQAPATEQPVEGDAAEQVPPDSNNSHDATGDAKE